MSDYQLLKKVSEALITPLNRSLLFVNMSQCLMFLALESGALLSKELI